MKEDEMNELLKIRTVEDDVIDQIRQEWEEEIKSSEDEEMSGDDDEDLYGDEEEKQKDKSDNEFRD
jgi:hypothetical protein